MHQIQAEIGIPKIKIQTVSGGTISSGKGDDGAKGEDKNKHLIFLMSPLPPGYGTTVGNALRRVLLSSLPGACVTGVKIEGVKHEYSTIKGLKESVLDLLLNLKKLDIRKTDSSISTITLNVTKEGDIFAKDIKCTSEVEIINPDLKIGTLAKGGKLNMELRVEKGVGYVPATLKEKDETDPEIILLDSFFSPVKKVRYDVEATRIGQMTNLDKLTIEILTNGAITPEDALKFASNILLSYFKLFNIEEIMVEEEYMSNIQTILEKEKEEAANKPVQESYTPIEILGFSPRTLNALINGGIGSIEQLSQCTESKLSNLRGFGKKALTEVRSALEKRGQNLAEE